MTYTPGPWFTTGGQAIFSHSRNGKDGGWVASTKQSMGAFTAAEAKANAQLIAAAPELLEALEAMGSALSKDASLRFFQNNVALMERCASVILKARGKS